MPAAWTSARCAPTRSRPTGLLLKDPGRASTRVHYYRAGSAASALGPDLLAGPAVQDAGLLHLTGITPALSASCRDLVEQALRGPVPVSFDVNHRPGAVGSGRGRPRCCGRWPTARTSSWSGWTRRRRCGAARSPTAADVRALLPGPRLLVVKDGARAATAFDGASAYTVPALATHVVEPVGAGDAFAAGFLAGLHRGEPLTRALRLGHLTAGAALRVSSDHGPLPPPARIAALLAASEAEWRRSDSAADRPEPPGAA